MIPNSQQLKQLQVEILKALKPLVNKALDEIENKYPKWRSSRFLTSSPDKMTFGFANEEADAVEDGVDARPISGVYVQRVRSHKRDVNKSTRVKKPPRQITVKQHIRTYRGYNPIQLPNGDFRMVSRIPERKGQKLVAKTAATYVTPKQIGNAVATLNGLVL